MDFVSYFETKIDATSTGYVCLICNNFLKHKRSIRRHFDDAHGPKNKYCCPGCQKIYNSRSSFSTHLYQYHAELKGINFDNYIVQ